MRSSFVLIIQLILKDQVNNISVMPERERDRQMDRQTEGQTDRGREGLSTPNRSSGLYKHISSSLTFVSVVLAQRPPHI